MSSQKNYQMHDRAFAQRISKETRCQIQDLEKLNNDLPLI